MINVDFLKEDKELTKVLNDFKNNWLVGISEDRLEETISPIYKILKDSTPNQRTYEQFIRSELDDKSLTRIMNTYQQSKNDAREALSFNFHRLSFFTEGIDKYEHRRNYPFYTSIIYEPILEILRKYFYNINPSDIWDGTILV